MIDFLRLRGLRPVRVEESDNDLHVYAESTQAVSACVHCASPTIVGFGRHERLVRDLPGQGRRVGIYIDGRRFRCRACSKTFFERHADVNDARDMTKRLVDWIGSQSIKRPFAHVAEETGVTEGTVRGIFAAYVQQLGSQIRFETPEWLGIDEIHIIKKPRAVIGNVRENTIIDMLPDRNKASIVDYFTRMPDRQRVKIVTMDMWTPYRDAARLVLPGATVVVDKFHVVRMANAALEAVRKAHRAALTPQARRGLMHDRFVLLKRAAELTDRDYLLLSGWTANYPALKDAYDAKEAFFGLYDCTSRVEAEQYYGAWENSVSDDVAWAFKDLRTAMKNWRPEILNYFDHRVTNAFIESMNNLIRLMNRIGRGYSFEALRAKVLYTDKLHKIQRPKFERKQRIPEDAIGYGVPDDSMGRWTPPVAAAGRNLGTDVATLIATLEADSL